MYTQPKSIVFLGPPGSGKGTQATRLSAALEVPAISTGEILRRECQSGTALGKSVEATLKAGKLVSDEQMNRLVERRLANKDCRGGCILDGYPRTVEQAMFLDGLLRRQRAPRPVVFDFALSAEQLIARLDKRRQCPTCSRIFSLQEFTSATALLCPNDRSTLVARSDDEPAAIHKRLENYQENSSRLVAYYKGAEYHRVAAGNSMTEVTGQLFDALGLRGAMASLAPRPQVAMATC